MTIKDSGQRTEYGTGFVRDMHEGKGRFDLLPWGAIWELAKHSEEGAIKYGERNIDKGAPQHSLVDSALRHLAKYLMGWNDENHLRAALWNVAWALEQDTYKPEMQDIPARLQQEEPQQEELCDDPALLCENHDCADNRRGRCLHGDESRAHHCGGYISPWKCSCMGPVKTRACVEFTCYNNTAGRCESSGGAWDPTMGTNCPEYSED